MTEEIKLVLQDGSVLYARGIGKADLESGRQVDENTLFYIASSTKSFTGLAIALLEKKGLLRLDDPLSKFLPDLVLQAPLEPRKITLRQLLTHTHGIDNNGPVTFRLAYSGQHTPELLIDLLSEHGPASQGTDFRYTNLGYNVAGLAIDRLTGRSWKDVLAQEIFGCEKARDVLEGMGRDLGPAMADLLRTL